MRGKRNPANTASILVEIFSFEFEETGGGGGKGT
jgi:hypothetical protein